MQITLPAFGAIIPGQGGRFAGIMRGPIVAGLQREPYAILVVDQSLEFEAEWGKYGADVVEARSRIDGKTNTAAMLAAGSPAAKRLAELEVDGHKDLYIPSLGELNVAAACVPELFAGEAIYWTSSQASRNYAFVQDFAGGNSYWDVKDTEFRVRPFRQIQLQLLNP